MSESQSLSLIEEISAPYKALLISLDNRTYNYATVLKLVVDEEPGVSEKESKFPGPIIQVTPCDATMYKPARCVPLLDPV